MHSLRTVLCVIVFVESVMCNIQDSSSHHVILKPNRSLGSLLPRFENIWAEVSSCGCNHVTVFSTIDNVAETETLVSQALALLPIPFTLYQVKTHEFGSAVYQEYVHNGRTCFALFPENDSQMLREVNSLFHNHSYGELAALPHRSKWLVFHNGSGQGSLWSESNSVLDNLAEVHLQGERIIGTRTLLWRQQRRRQWDLVALNSLGTHCSIFPNRLLGLNGRSLVGIAFREELMVALHASHTPSGDVEYSGYMYDLSVGLQKALNFTSSNIILLPNQVDILVYSHCLKNGTADFGLVGLSLQTIKGAGLKATVSIRMGGVTGAYVFEKSRPNKDAIDLNNKKLRCILYVVVLMISISMTNKFFSFIETWLQPERSISGEIRGRGLEFCREKWPSTTGTSSSFPKHPISTGNAICFQDDEGCDLKNTNQRTEQAVTCKKDIPVRFSIGAKILMAAIRVYHKVPDLHVIETFGTIFGFDTLQRPKSMYARIFLFSWYLCVLLIESMLVSTMAAVYIKPLNPPTFTTISDVLHSNEVDCGSFLDTELQNMKRKWALGGRNSFTDLRRFPISLRSSPMEFRRFMEEAGDKRKMFVYYRDILKHIKHAAQFENLYILKDDFINIPISMSLPPNSDLVDIFSGGISTLTEFGILQKTMEKYFPSEKNKDNNKVAKSDSKGFLFFRNVFYLLAMGTCLSGLTLGLEVLLNHLICWYSLQQLL